jgi:hypothetical protein
VKTLRERRAGVLCVGMRALDSRVEMPDRLSRLTMRETGRIDEAMVCFGSRVEFPWDGILELLLGG